MVVSSSHESVTTLGLENREKKRRKSTTRPKVITCDGVESDNLFIVAK